jgi:hypothetical protein
MDGGQHQTVLRQSGRLGYWDQLIEQTLSGKLIDVRLNKRVLISRGWWF